MEKVTIIRHETQNVTHYEDCTKIFLGVTDMASLLFRPCSGDPQSISCGYDGAHNGYIVTDTKVEIPAYFEKVLECEHWLKVYDDESLVAELWGSVIEVLRSHGVFIFRVAK